MSVRTELPIEQMGLVKLTCFVDVGSENVIHCND